MENKPNRNLYKIIAALVILTLIITFSLQNNTDTMVSLWFWKADAPLILLFLISFIAGLLFALLGIAPVFMHSRRKSKLIEELKERIDLLEKENSKNN